MEQIFSRQTDLGRVGERVRQKSCLGTLPAGRSSGDYAGWHWASRDYYCAGYHLLGPIIRRLCIQILGSQKKYLVGRGVERKSSSLLLWSPNNRGWRFTAAVIDGRRGLAGVFKDIPVQVCHFHQLKIVTKYLTRRPKTEAGKELRRLALTLSRTNEKTFSTDLDQWEKKWRGFIRERTYIVGTNRFYYTHKNVRSAFLSLKRNLPHLFTFQKYSDLNIPNTTNTVDGCFASIKKKVGAHHGLRKDRRFKVISELLKNNGKE